MTDMMEEVLKTGTAAGYAIQGGRMATAGKSGTTNEVRDKWFVGYTPYLLGVTWFGYDTPRSFPELAQPKIIWKAVMEAAHQGLAFPPAAFAEPAGLVHAAVCLDSGLLPTANCAKDGRAVDGKSRIASFPFKPETVPTAECAVHQPSVSVCALSGGMATAACPVETVREISYLKKPEPWQLPQPGDPPSLDAAWETRELAPCVLHPAPDEAPNAINPSDNPASANPAPASSASPSAQASPALPTQP